MAESEWEQTLARLGDACWEEATELASMIADDAYPTILRDDYTRQYAAKTVVSLCRDPDYRRCVEWLLAHSKAVPSIASELRYAPLNDPPITEADRQRDTYPDTGSSGH